MQRNAVQSSNIRSVGYDPIDRVLEIEFSSGSVYQYAGVEPDVVTDLMAAPSIGSHFGRYIRPSYTGVPVTDEEPEDEDDIEALPALET